MRFIDRIPFVFLLLATLFMLGAPFVPEPHLVEKMRMLAAGSALMKSVARSSARSTLTSSSSDKRDSPRTETRLKVRVYRRGIGTTTASDPSNLMSC